MKKTAKLQTVRGTHDLTGESMRLYRYISDKARSIASLYDFSEVSPPIFEYSDVFHRTLGESSDVISKETYSFLDRGGESLTLRPEFTASIVRAFISGGYTQKLPFKAFYSGPAFRYERPQKGRQRQFHQIGVEMLGGDTPLADVEVIACAYQLLNALGFAKKLTLEINSLGDDESRANYRVALVEYLAKHKASLSAESVERLEKNPLRVLDSKQPEDKDIVKGAPVLQDYFSVEAKDWFASVTSYLEALDIPFELSTRLVRGLDYYTHTVFEFTTDALGSQNTVLAGGRYNGLVEQMGGPNISGVGWAAGMERLMLLTEALNLKLLEDEAPYVALLPLSELEWLESLKILHSLRNNGIKSEIMPKGNIGKRLKKLDGAGVQYVIMVGSEELSEGAVLVKDLFSGEQQKVKIDKVLSHVV